MAKTPKSGINQAIRCKGCGKKVGFVRLKGRLKWKTIKWSLAIAFVFEFIANVLVYFLFE